MRISDWSSDVCSSDLSPFEAFEPARRRDYFGDLDAIAAVDADDFALRDEGAVGINVEQVGRGAIEFDHAAFTEREQFGKRHRGRADLDRHAQRDAGEQVEIGSGTAALVAPVGARGLRGFGDASQWPVLFRYGRS